MSATIPRTPERAPVARRLSAVGALALCVCGGAQALSFTEALEAARRNDSAYRAADYELQGAQLNVPIARAALLPSVALTATNSKVQGSRTLANAQNQEMRLPLEYTAPHAALQARMPLFNYEAISQLKQAQAQAQAAEHVYRSHGLDLMERLATTYLNALLAEEGRRLAQAQVRQYETQASQADQRLQRGEGTRVQQSTAHASLDVARTRLLEAVDQVGLARARLERLTGIGGAAAEPLPAAVTVDPLFPDRMGDWIELAVRHSPTLKSRELNREVARQGRKRQEAGHYPRLDVVASVSRSENESISAIGQSTVVRSVGVQLNVPIYNGGGVDASVRQAAAKEAQAEQEVRAEREAIEIDVQRYFQAAVNGEKKVAAYVKAVASTELAARGARRAFETGLGTLSDVSDAESTRFSAARDLIQARVEVLLSRVRLMMRSGMPLGDVAQEVDRALKIAPAAAPPNEAPAATASLPTSPPEAKP